MRRFLSFAMAAVLLMAGCAKDYDSLSASDETVAVTFSANLPIEVSRTVGDGSQANVLNYAIYDTNGNLFTGYPYEDNVAVSGNKATVKLDLVKGQTYKVAFWAQSDKAPYTFDRDNSVVTVTYGTDESNNEKYDAFYACEEIEVTGPAVKNITLRRPFAQINLGATKADVEAAKALGVEIGESKVTLTNVYTKLALYDGVASEPTSVAVNFDYNTLPGNDLTVNKVDYEYIAANYILANTEADVTELTFSLKDTNGNEVNTDVAIPSVNYKRNYRTNILGRLLTSAVDFNIVIDGTPDGDIGQSWDGSTVQPAGVNADGDYVISNAEQLAWFANAVNGTLPAVRSGEAVSANSFEGKNVILASNISLSGKEWAPIGTSLDKCFRGNFDGKGFVISDFVVSKVTEGPAGLFGVVRGKGSFKNLVIDNATVLCPVTSGETNFYGAALVGQLYGEHEFYGITVQNSKIQGNGKTGGLFGFNGDCAQTVRNCHVVDSTIESTNPEDGGNIGGLIGFLQSVGGGSEGKTFLIEQSSVSGTTINAYNSSNSGKRANAELIGCWNGKEGWTLEINDCTTEGNTLNQTVNGTNAVTYKSVYGEYANLIGGHRTDALAGKVIINGVEFIALTPIDGYSGVALDPEGNYVIIADEGMASISKLITEDENNFAGKTIKLNTDVDLTNIKTHGNSFGPLGSTGERDDRNRIICEPFKGTFDGQGHSIKNLYQSGWDFGYEWGQYGSLGLFAELESATVKNVVLEGHEAQVEGGDISYIAGSATGTCVFEDIEIKSGGIGTYNNGCGGIIGWSGAGNYTFKNIKLGADVVLGGLWGSFDSSIGGIVGQAEPGATYNFENVEINCRIDAYNDCTASYDYYNYRMCGMIIGRCEATTTIDGTNYPDLSKYNISCKNVTVNYGDWMNYHYCEPTPGLNGGRGMRVEPGFAYGGLPEDFDHSQCVDNHYNCIPFDQLIGGDQIAVKGLREVAGVTVNYPAKYTCSLCGQEHGK